jgi:hypothetical protein
MIARRTITGVAAAFALAIGVSNSASAQFIAPFAGYNVDLEELVVGGGVGLPISLGMASLVIQPGFEYYPGVEGATLYTFMVDLHYALPLPKSPVKPYFGGGYALNRASAEAFGVTVSATNSQLNALGGVSFGSGPFSPFVEGNLRFVDGSSVVLKGGGRIRLGS